MELDSTDLRMAAVAVEYYKRAHILSRRPVPEAAYRLSDHLSQALAVNGQGTVAPQPDWLSTGQVAERLGVSPRTARRVASRVGCRVGRTWLVPTDALPSASEEDNGAAAD